jgi:hypothetical protein
MGGRVCLVFGFALFVGASIFPLEPPRAKLTDRWEAQPLEPQQPKEADPFAIVQIAEWIIPVR